MDERNHLLNAAEELFRGANLRELADRCEFVRASRATLWEVRMGLAFAYEALSDTDTIGSDVRNRVLDGLAGLLRFER